MGLLPCLRRGSDRWWLPLSTIAIEALGQVMLAHGRGPNQPRRALPRRSRRSDPDVVDRDRSIRGRLIHVLQHDPPLAIYSALYWPGEEASLPDLADWLVENITGRFSSGDAFLGAPSIRIENQRRWNKLFDHYRMLPLDEWMSDAALWLEATGPRVSKTWIEQWPRIHSGDEVNDCIAAESGDSMLQKLARMMQRQRSLEQSFDDRLHKSKLGALKQLAYGLSHEINNPLANISTRAQQLQRGEDDPTRQAVLQRIVDQVYRAHEMIADLMFYAHPPAPDAQVADLNVILDQVTAGFREEADRQAIRLEVDFHDGEAAEAKVDATMIGEAIRALVRNSIDAIGCEGTIVVSLVRQEERWLIHVADSGPGLSHLARQHAFDPYYSGREAGRGLGLGLCRAYRIAKLHTGDVTLAGGPTGCVATISLRDS
ncbi:MAG: HAMP domain-containing histidine kinase [Pirellulaceae bacterium]|nr:HAMP domain-containing histidine kinase [Pirellulaceae bacterium]